MTDVTYFMGPDAVLIWPKSGQPEVQSVFEQGSSGSGAFLSLGNMYMVFLETPDLLGV